MKTEREGMRGIFIAPAKLPRHFLGCRHSRAVVFLTCCPERDVAFERKFHCGADGKPAPPFEVSS